MNNYQAQLLLLFLFSISCKVLCQEKDFTFKIRGQRVTYISGDIMKVQSEKTFNSKINIEHLRIGNAKHDVDSVYLNSYIF